MLWLGDPVDKGSCRRFCAPASLPFLGLGFGCVCNLLFINRYMRPEGPWQRLAAALAGSSGISIHNLVLAQTDNRQF